MRQLRKDLEPVTLVKNNGETYDNVLVNLQSYTNTIVTQAFNIPFEEGDLIEYYKYPEKKYEIINVESERKPTDLQFDCLVDMIEKGTDAVPTIDEVFSSFDITLRADDYIRNR